MRNKLTTSLVVVNIAMLGIVAWFTWASLSPPRFPSTAPALTASDEPPLVFRYESVLTDHLATNPVFSQSRVWPRKAGAQPTPPAAIVRPRLAGITTTDRAPSRALLEDPANQQRSFVSLGQTFLGWKIVAIEHETVTLLPSSDSADTTHNAITLHIHQHEDAWISTHD